MVGNGNGNLPASITPALQRTIPVEHIMSINQWIGRFAAPGMQQHSEQRQPSPEMVQQLEVQAELVPGQPVGATGPGVHPGIRRGPGAATRGSSASTGLEQQKQALQQLLQVLSSPNSAEQQQQILNILYRNPPLMAAFIKQRQINRTAALAAHGGPDAATQGCSADTGSGMQNQSAQHFLQVLGSCNLPEQKQQILQILRRNPRLIAAFIIQRQRNQTAAAAAHGMSGVAAHSSFATTDLQKQTLQEFLQVLRSPNRPEKLIQILQMLRRNPQLMAAFIKWQREYRTGAAAA